MDSSRHPLEAMVIERKPLKPRIIEKPKAPQKIELNNPTSTLPHIIDLDKIQKPALLFNSQLKIVWQNSAALEKIWRNPGSWDQKTPEMSLFDLIFDPVFKKNIANFKICIKFFLTQILAMITKEQLHQQIKVMDDNRKSVVLPLIDPIDPVNTSESLHGAYLHQTLRSGEMFSFGVTAMNFDEGRLLIFESVKQADTLLQLGDHQRTKQHFEIIRRQPESVKMPYVLLAAQLNKAATLRTQMLADEYRRLIKDLCQRSLYKVEQFGGIFGKHIESGFFVYFLSDPEEPENILPIIECVLEMKDLMIDMGREWKIRKDWQHDIALNMGLHWENQYVDILKSSSGEAITSFGDGLQIASAISQLAQDGQIWATKTLIQQLSTDSHRQLRFGILRADNPRHQPFIRNGFSCIKDVFDPSKTRAALEEGFNLLPVTQIFDLSG